MKSAWIGLGGNVGNVRASMIAALDALAASDTTIAAVSALYETPPWGPVQQPRFLNACATIRTEAAPARLLARLHEIEADLQRRRVERWGPRTIDLDLLAYEDYTSAEPGLTVPHPRATERAFVLVPLSDIAPDLKLDGVRVADLAAAADRTGMTSVAEDWYPRVSAS